MDVLQTWLVVGVPGLAILAGLFAGYSRVRARLGYVALVALVVAFAATPGGGASAAVIGTIGVVLVATGRGTRLDRAGEHHHNRRRYTTTAGA